VAVTKVNAAAIAVCAVLLVRPAHAEAVYEFVKHCHDEKLGHCFNRIGTRLSGLNTGPNRRICLPRSFGGTMVESGVIPVSLLEHVRLKLSAARFGDAGSDVDAVITRIVNGIYPCDLAAKRTPLR
jgi:hypothetical protein